MMSKKFYVILCVGLLVSTAVVEPMQWLRQQGSSVRQQLGAVWKHYFQRSPILTPQERFERALLDNNHENSVQIMRELLERDALNINPNQSIDNKHPIINLIGQLFATISDELYKIQTRVILEKINLLIALENINNICQITNNSADIKLYSKKGKEFIDLMLGLLISIPVWSNKVKLSAFEFFIIKLLEKKDNILFYNTKYINQIITHFVDAECKIISEYVIIKLFNYYKNDPRVTENILSKLFTKKAFLKYIFQKHILFTLLLFYSLLKKNSQYLKYVLSEAPEEFINKTLAVKWYKKIDLSDIVFLEYINNLFGEQKPIHLAVLLGSLEQIGLLLQYGADINAQNNQGETPLHVAVTENNILAIEWLLENGANINVRDKDNNSPIDISSTVEVFELLYNWNAKINIANFKTELLSDIFRNYTILLYHSTELKDPQLTELFLQKDFRDKEDLLGQTINFVNLAHELFIKIENDSITTVVQLHDHFGKYAQQLRKYLDIKKDKDIEGLKTSIIELSDEEKLKYRKDDLLNTKKLFFYVQTLP